MFNKLCMTITSLLVAAVLVQTTPVIAAEHQHAEVKKEGADAMAKGTKGVSEGTIVSNEKGKVILTTKEGNILFMAHWRGGMPKDGGGMDKAMLETLAQYKAGDQVKIAWVWEERRRVEQIQKVGGKD
jgi:hypothetical protein